MRLRTTAATGTLLTAALSGSVFLFASPASAESNGQAHVTLCHRTGSESHPYVEITVAEAGAYHGHSAHPHKDVLHVALEPGDPEYSADICSPDAPGGEDSPAPAEDTDIPVDEDTPATSSDVTEPPLAEDTPATPSEDDVAPVTEDTDEAPVAAASPTSSGSEDMAAEGNDVTADEVRADEQSETSVVPAGAPDTGDGSAADSGGSALPYLLGGVALTAAGGAAFAARRSSRASA